MMSIILLGATLAATAASAQNAAAAEFTLNSPDYSPSGRIAPEQACRGSGSVGSNLSPALGWRGAPPATRSFALTVFDADAPGGGFWHWVVFDIPSHATMLAKGAGEASGRAMPAGSLQARNDFGETGYGGPCPPPGDPPHHYRFTLYALDVAKLPVRAGTKPAAIAEALKAHTLARATLTGLYSR